MSEGLIAIRMRLFGAKATAAEAKAVSTEVAATGDAAAASGARAARAAKGVGVLRKGWGLLGKTVKWGTGILGVGGVFAIADAARTTEQLAKDTKTLSRLTGLDNLTSSEWLGVARQRGVEAKVLNMAFVTFSKNIRNARQGSSAAVTAFKQLGISMDDVQHMTTQDLIMKVSDAYKDMGENANRTAINQQLFGRASQRLISVFAEGHGEIQKQLNTTKKYGAVMGKNAVDKTLETVRAQRELGLAWDGLSVTLGKALMPFLQKASDWFARFLNQLRTGKGTGGDVRDVFESIGKTLETLWPFVQNVLLPLAEGIWKTVGPAIQFLATALGWIGKAAAPLRPIMVALGVLIGLLVGPELAAAKAGTWLGRLFKWLPKTVQVVIKIFGFFGKRLSFIQKVVVAVAAQIGASWSDVKQWTEERFGSVIDFFGKLPGKIGGALKGLGEIIAKPFIWAFNKIKSVVQWIVDKIKWVVEKIQWAMDHIPDVPNLGGGSGGIDLPGPLPNVGGSNSGIGKVLGALSGRATGPGAVLVGSGGGAMEPVPVTDLGPVPVGPLAQQGGQRPLVVQTSVNIDGKKVAEAVTRHASNARARK